MSKKQSPSPTPHEATSPGDNTITDGPDVETTDTAVADSSTDAAEVKKSALAQTPKIVWLITALIAAACLLVGYITGHAVGMKSATEAIDKAVAQAQGAGENPADPNAAKPEQPTMSFDEIQKKLKPGKDTSAPKPSDGELFNADIVGGRGKVSKAAEAYNVHRRNPNDPFAIGRVDAPVVISEFSDFECPFCSRFANVTEPELIKKYVDSGYVRLEFNDLPINGPHADAAAKASRAAAEQGRYHEFATELFNASKDLKGHPGFTIDNFKEFAQKAGVKDMDKFTADATGTKYDAAINNAKVWAQELGIRSTPSFVIGGILVAGAQPTATFEDAINSELSKVARGEVTVPAADPKAGLPSSQN